MAYYSITKTLRKNINVYQVRVRNKESGVVTFSKSKTFQSKVAAKKWAKSMVHKVELLLNALKEKQLHHCYTNPYLDIFQISMGSIKSVKISNNIQYKNKLKLTFR